MARIWLAVSDFLSFCLNRGRISYLVKAIFAQHWHVVLSGVITNNSG